MSNQSQGVYTHAEVVTQSPVHGGLVPTQGGTSPIHGANGLGGSAVFDFLVTYQSTQEGNTGTGLLAYTVRRSGNLTGTDVLDYAVSGFGANPAQTANFPGNAFPSGTLTFVPGDIDKVIYIATTTNTAWDVDRDFILTISGHPGIINALAYGTILNDDPLSPSPGASATTTATTPTVHYHPNSQSATLDGSSRVLSCPDIRGLAALSGVAYGGGTIGPVEMTDGWGRKFWRFSPTQALLIANTLAGLNSRSMTVFMVMRQHKVTRGMDSPYFSTRYSAYTDDTTNTARTNGYVLRVQCNTGTSEVPRMKSGTTDSFAGHANSPKMIPGAQLQVVGFASRSGASAGTDVGGRFYMNNDAVPTAQSSLTGTADVGGIIGAKATSSNAITGTTDTGFDLYEFILVKGSLTDAQADAIAAALVSNYAIPTIDSQLIILGDSVFEAIDTSSTVVVPADNMAVTLTAPGAELVPTSCRVINAAVAGSACQTFGGITGVVMSSQRDDAAGPLKYQYPGGATKNIILFNTGINDMRSSAGNFSAATHYANVVALINTTTTGYLQRGYSVVVATPTAISGDSTGQGRIAAYRDLIVDPNTDIVVDQFLTDTLSNTGQTYAGLVSVLPICKIENGSSGTIFLNSADAGDTLYYATDGTHQTPAAMTLLATGGDTPQYGLAGLFDLITPAIQFSVSGAQAVPEGNTGTTTITYTILRSGNLSGSATVDWITSATGLSPMQATDFVGGVFPSGTATFGDGIDTVDVSFDIVTNTLNEPDKTYLFALNNPTASTPAKLTAPYSAIGTVLNDDAPGGLQIVDLGSPAATEAFIRAGYGTEWTPTGVLTQTKLVATSTQDLLAKWNTVKNNANSYSERWEIECDWDGPSALTAGEGGILSLLGKKALTNGWVEGGGWVKIYGKAGKRPAISNRVKLGAMRGVTISNLGFGGKWDGAAGKQSTQYGTQIFVNTTYPAENIINFDSCFWGRTFYDSTQVADNYITGILSSGVSEQIVVANSSLDGCYFGAALVARRTRVSGCDFNRCNGDYMHFFGHKKTGYYAYIILENLTLRGPIQALAYRNLHQDMYQTGARADTHLGYRLLSKNIRAHLDHMYNGDPGAGGGSQGSYNDDYLNSDNLFCLIDCDHHAASPHSFAYWSPKGTYRSYVDHCTFGRCGRVPSQFPGDVYSPEDFDPGVTGNSLPSKIPGIALTVMNTLASRLITNDAKIQNVNNVQFTHTIGGALRPEDIFNGANFERGGASTSNGIAGKFGYLLPNETGTQAQFLASMAANWTPQGQYASLGARPINLADFTAVGKPSYAA